MEEKKSLKDKYFHLRRNRLDSQKKPVTQSRVGNWSSGVLMTFWPSFQPLLK